MTLGLVAVIEYAVIKLPNHDSNGVLSSIANKTVGEAKEILSARDVRLILRQTTIPAEATALLGSPSVNVKAGSSPVIPVTSVAAPSNYLPVVGDTGPSSPGNPKFPQFAKPTDYLPVGDDPTPTPIVVPTAAPSDYLPVKNKGDGTSAAAPSAYLPVGSVYLPIDDGKSVPASTASPSAYLPINNNPKPKIGPPGNTQPEKQGSPGNGSPAAADTTNYLPVAGGHNPTSTPTITYSAATSSNYLPVGETTVGAVPSGDYLPVDTRIYNTAAHSNYISAYNPHSGGMIPHVNPRKRSTKADMLHRFHH